jgi:ADP-ribose pyrophosphatase YjhB (NUDIX family)
MDALLSFLAQYQPQTTDRVTWGSLRLQVTSYRCAAVPPLEWITSVRAIVCTDRAVLLVRDPDGHHILPGGRREANETLVQTVQREVLEETGWEIAQPQLLGFTHFHHLDAKPVDYPYPYPDFVQLIFAARPAQYHAAARDSHGYERESQLVDLATLTMESLSPAEQQFLRVAVPF